MLLSLEDFVVRAERCYRDSGWVDLRSVERDIETVLHNRHQIDIPPSLVGRAVPIYSSIAMEKLMRASGQLTDSSGMPRFTVPPSGTSAKVARQREQVQNWISAAIAETIFSGKENIDSLITYDLLVRSRAFVRVLPVPALWESLAEQVSTEEEPDFSEADSVSAVWEAADSYLAGLEDAAGLLRDRAKIKRRAFPISVVWVPGDAVFDDWDEHGLKEILEYREMPVSYVLSTYVDTDGAPLARELAESVNQVEMTADQVCTLVIRADREHMQIAILPVLLDSGVASATERFTTQEIIWEGPHGMGCVPYAYFPGRVTGAAAPKDRFYSFVRPVTSLAVDLDRVLTQRSTSARMMAWPHLYIRRMHQLAETGNAGADRPGSVQIDEGGIFEGLMPGEDFAQIPWATPESYRILDQTEAAIRADIDRHTFGPVAYGAPAGDSGYMLAQMQAAADTVLLPFRQGKSLGYERLSAILLRAARWLIASGCGPIPVRHITDDGLRWVEVDEEIVQYDWDVKVDINPKPIGGDQALLVMLRGAEDAGYISHTTAMSRYGVRDTEREKERVLHDRALFHPKIQEVVVESGVSEALAALARPAPPSFPDQPVVPGALAGLIGGSVDPSAAKAAVRLASNRPTSSPTEIEGMRAAGVETPGEFKRHGGPTFGQAQTLPGGLARISEIVQKRGS